MNVVIYARFSSHSQTEQSIEGQLKICYEYASSNNHTVVGEYIDRAQSGTSDNRSEFQRMIADSDRHTFEGVLVYQLDRFARNRYDSAINKAKLKKNGVRVLSAKENISDDASGILIEGVLESMAEYYSVELSQKIHRGMEINAQKHLSNGSNPGLGYKVNSDKTFYVDESEAAVVNEIFERYASGETAASIIRDLNNRKITTSIGREFNKNSLHRLLKNKRYIGMYVYKGEGIPGGMPCIVNIELFERVQRILEKNKKAPSRSRGKQEYLLTTKLFCGYCKEMMTGCTGTSKNGDKYHYYVCNKAKRKECDKKTIRKDIIENSVIQVCNELLTDDKIKFIAEEIYAACQNDGEALSIKRLKSALSETEKAIENLWIALEKGQAADMITERINQREIEKQKIQKQLAIEMQKQGTLEFPFIVAFFEHLKSLPDNDEYKRKALISIFVNSIYLYDGYFTLILNAGNKHLDINDVPLDDIEATFNYDANRHDKQNCICNKESECSSIVASAPPNGHWTNITFFNGGFAVRGSLAQ